MVSPDSKSSAVKNRRCSPATIIITACLISLIAGFTHDRYFRDLKIGIFSLLSVSTLRPTSQQVSPPLGIQAWKPGSSVCLNTCSKARNGVCEDGRMNVTSYEVRLVHCDLGTDCDDCGPWTPSGPVSWSTSAAATTDKEALNTGPIALLKSLDIEVRVRRTRSTGPQFDFAFTDPAKDYDVSYHMQNTGGVELSITKIFYKIFEQKCRLPATDDSPGVPSALFVDVGGNFGWFSMLAAAMGCR
ncbi:hypothetical protein CEUSTIGMA_g4629.t1 [Chlamydomonas eustigma]|uniref:Methyltransferase FkbM domain-containing protein n=1 Tax=Chlamydomonas eustigma TaxID=1157962 RepID=A0A250X264_9CHLO|nr:hypothetical protein CEUSTIGMA_g4629.t1 [Chlamydomonas eustigma]|eukprot:GAX77183.1 hypothetical protein CEUSTIGMA_g4629.t1 [Chlamydomonas eustigma]